MFKGKIIVERTNNVMALYGETQLDEETMLDRPAR
jgi:hypothetical protein